MKSETNNLEDALIFLSSRYEGRLAELAEKIGVSRPTVSVFLKTRKTTRRNENAILDLWEKEKALAAHPQKETPGCIVIDVPGVGRVSFPGDHAARDAAEFALRLSAKDRADAFAKALPIADAVVQAELDALKLQK